MSTSRKRESQSPYSSQHEYESPVKQPPMYESTPAHIDTDVTNYSTASDLDTSRELNEIPTFTVAVQPPPVALTPAAPSVSAPVPAASATGTEMMQEAVTAKRDEEGGYMYNVHVNDQTCITSA